jgi:hypothetical protein
MDVGVPVSGSALPEALVPNGSPEPALPKAPERYRVQFTASEEYVQLLQQAKDLASHALPSGSIEQLQLQAMRLLVAELKKRRHAALKLKPRRAAKANGSRQRDTAEVRATRQRDTAEVRATRQRGNVEADLSRQRGETDLSRQRGDGEADPEPPSSPRQRHHVPAPVQRTVWSRDGSRCTHVDGRRRRCRETAFLELHHLQPEALGGPPTAENLTLRCKAHNALAAEQDFGRDFMETKRRAGSKPESQSLGGCLKLLRQ